MQFIVGSSDSEDEPRIELIPDKWDDFGFKTLFTARHVDRFGRRTVLGGVKIGNVAVDPPKTTQLPESFESLPLGFVSQGQDVDYYRQLRQLVSEDEFERTLRDIGDLVARDDADFSSRDHTVITNSLRRGFDEHEIGRMENAFRGLPEPSIEEVLDWFRERYEDPVETLPHDSGEGGYQWILGGPWDARNELETEFSGRAAMDVIDEAVATLEAESVEWLKRSIYEQQEADDLRTDEVTAPTPSPPESLGTSSLEQLVSLERQTDPPENRRLDLLRQIESLVGQAELLYQGEAWARTPDVEIDVRSTIDALRSELYPPIDRAPSYLVVEGLGLRLSDYLLATEPTAIASSSLAAEIQSGMVEPLERASSTGDLTGATDAADWLAEHMDWKQAAAPAWLADHGDWTLFVEEAERYPYRSTGALLGWVTADQTSATARVIKQILSTTADGITAGVAVGGLVGLMTGALPATGIGALIGAVLGALIALLAANYRADE